MEQKAVVTVIGQDTVGIIATVTAYVAEHNVNILNISQTIVDGFFNMMMIVDYAHIDVEFAQFVNGLEQVGQQRGVVVRCQRSEIFTSMHRI